MTNIVREATYSASYGTYEEFLEVRKLENHLQGIEDKGTSLS